jgi:hypothetical protein
MADLLKALFDFPLLTAMDLLGQSRVMLLKPPFWIWLAEALLAADRSFSIV